MDEVASGVLVATSRRDTTTTTVVVRGGSALLVDPAWEPDELDELAALPWTVELGLSTHAHHDHLLWHPGFGSAPRYASARTVALASSERAGLVEALGPFPSTLVALLGDVQVAPPDLEFAGEPVELVVHDGHAPGHTAVWLPARRVLLAGDMLSDVELPLPLWPDDLPAYLAGLDTLAPYVAAAEILVPGHGHVTSRPADRLEADRRYLDALVAGRDPDDPRRENPGMREVHERVRELARAL
jgi:glyoxylase-like metal-dependent hydrolase (beta-lactamase superfamily II)